MSGVKSGSFSRGSSPSTSWSMGQLKKVFQEYALMSGLQRAALSTESTVKKYFISYTTGLNLRDFKFQHSGLLMAFDKN